MRALRFHKTGSLDNLMVEEGPMPTPTPGEVLIEVKAAAINPSDIKNVQGKMHLTTAEVTWASRVTVVRRNMWQFLLPRWSLCLRT
jgi:NADPH:quinone reductase-like Zn-dependent oxidoreductase